ncbi:MAG TPA: hypothetical protein VHU89_13435 [Acidobacteriaceae bacterium]|jgi:urocanate hydratase|nr:hypothetical protein [Acidobacteriaceae bacterium]
MKLRSLHAVYDRYETLTRLARDRFAGSLAGKLLLGAGLDSEQSATLVAASIAGACSLCVEPEAERLREALRAGLCDFVVTPLDEALRILKNELRRGLPVVVGLASDPDSALAAMIDRGLQPDLVSLPLGEPLRSFVDRGALALSERDSSDPATVLMEWTFSSDAARSMPQIAQIAARILDPARPDTPLRQHWLATAPRHLGRGFAARQCLGMSAAESTAFIATARTQFPAIHLTREGQDL